jgi:hypothetical protein
MRIRMSVTSIAGPNGLEKQKNDKTIYGSRLAVAPAGRDRHSSQNIQYYLQ